MDPRHIIVIGTSAGGLAATKKLISGLETGIDAAVIVVIHLSASWKIVR